MVRKLADEADGVGEENLVGGAGLSLVLRSQPDLARERVERREEPVLDEDVPLSAHRLEDRALPRVRVAHERRAERRLARLPLDFPALRDLAEPFLQHLDAESDEAPVGFELRFARAAHADATAELLEMRPHPREPRQGILELRQLHLHPALRAPRAHGEDVEDELGAVDHALADFLLEVLSLAWGELVVEDDDGGLCVRDERLQLLELALADVGGGVGFFERLRELADDDGAGGVGEAAEFFEVLSREM